MSNSFQATHVLHTGFIIKCHYLYINIIHVVYTTRVINLSFIKRVMLYQILPVRTIFDITPHFNAIDVKDLNNKYTIT